METARGIDPELQSAFDGLSADDGWEEPFDVAKIRDIYARRVAEVAAEPSDTIVRRDAVIRGPDGDDLRLRLYEPQTASRPLPAVLYVHGGGFVLGHVENFDAKCERCVSRVGALVVSVNYRLAPEYPFPAALEDCYAALRWMTAMAPKLAIDPARIAILGESAGGGIAAALALLVRDRGEVKPVLQALVGACLDDRHETASSRAITEPKVWNRHKSQLAWRAYLGTLGDAEVSEYAAPARASDLFGLPPAHIVVGELDPVRDENLEYATRLLAAGTPTELHVYSGAYHGFESAVPSSDSSRATVDRVFAQLRAALHTTGS